MRSEGPSSFDTRPSYSLSFDEAKNPCGPEDGRAPARIGIDDLDFEILGKRLGVAILVL